MASRMKWPNLQLIGARIERRWFMGWPNSHGLLELPGCDVMNAASVECMATRPCCATMEELRGQVASTVMAATTESYLLSTVDSRGLAGVCFRPRTTAARAWLARINSLSQHYGKVQVE